MNHRVPEHNIVHRLLDAHVEAGRGAAPCLVVDGVEYSYSYVTDATRRAAHVLAAAGARQRTRVLVGLPDGLHAVAAILAAVRLGGTPVPIAPGSGHAFVDFVLNDCGATVAVLDDGLVDGFHLAQPAEIGREHSAPPSTTFLSGTRFAEGVQAADPTDLLADVRANDAAVVQYTTGSTGVPKGVPHSHGGIRALADTTGRWLHLSPADRVLSTSKLSFGYGFGNSLLLPMLAGASSVLQSTPADPLSVAAALSRTHPTVLFSVPAFIGGLLRIPDAADRLDVTRLRRCVVGGENLPDTLSRHWEQVTGTPITNALGSTECLHIVLASEPGATDLGHPVPGVELRLTAGDDPRGPQVDEGLAWIRGPQTAQRYLDGGAGGTFVDGWVRTGDILRRHLDGVISYVGRPDDIMSVGGLKIAPSQVEEGLLTCELVTQCVAVGTSADEYGLEMVAAWIVPDPDRSATDEEILTVVRRHARRSLPASLRPSRYIISDRIPRNVNGKIARPFLRSLLNDSTEECR